MKKHRIVKRLITLVLAVMTFIIVIPVSGEETVAISVSHYDDTQDSDNTINIKSSVQAKTYSPNAYFRSGYAVIRFDEIAGETPEFTQLYVTVGLFAYGLKNYSQTVRGAIDIGNYLGVDKQYYTLDSDKIVRLRGSYTAEDPITDTEFVIPNITIRPTD